MTQTRRSRPALTLASCSNASNLWGLSAQSLSIRLGLEQMLEYSWVEEKSRSEYLWKNPALKCLWHGGLTIAMVRMKGYWPWNLIFFYWPCRLISQFAPTTVRCFGACHLDQSWKWRRRLPWIIIEISIRLRTQLLKNKPNIKWIFVDNLRIGAMYSFALEAFKLGS